MIVACLVLGFRANAGGCRPHRGHAAGRGRSGPAQRCGGLGRALRSARPAASSQGCEHLRGLRSLADMRPLSAEPVVIGASVYRHLRLLCADIHQAVPARHDDAVLVLDLIIRLCTFFDDSSSTICVTLLYQDHVLALPSQLA